LPGLSCPSISILIFALRNMSCKRALAIFVMYREFAQLARQEHKVSLFKDSHWSYKDFAYNFPCILIRNGKPQRLTCLSQPGQVGTK
jgi:hypothetical protein